MFDFFIDFFSQNPHKSTWAEMKLYLRAQVEARALEVWGTLDKIEEHKEKREEMKEISKAKKYNKKLSELRKAVRSTLYDKTTKSHVHEFGPSKCVDEENDEYYHKCLTCDFEETYEEM